MTSQPLPSKKKSPDKKPWRYFILVLLFLIIFLFIVLKACREQSLDPSTGLKSPARVEAVQDTLAADTVSADSAREPDSSLRKDTIPKKTVPKEESHLKQTGKDTADKYALVIGDTVVEAQALIDTLFVYADPWGGRHFDSVTVELFCREECLILYSLKDSVHLKSYDKPLHIRRNSSLWIAGMNDKGEQTVPVEIKYFIEKEKGDCPENMAPFKNKGTHVCMDVYEWPNREGAQPAAYVSRREAADSCVMAGKRLCSLEEWQIVCAGPGHSRYPYGNSYDENYCPAKEKTSRRSGRFPACRSYYGVYDMTGNLWEWTSTEYSKREGYYMVAGGNWNIGNQATCSQTKFSFFPQNRYLFVGFRCCQDIN